MNNHDSDFLKDLNIQSILAKEEEANISHELPMRKWLYS